MSVLIAVLFLSFLSIAMLQILYLDGIHEYNRKNYLFKGGVVFEADSWQRDRNQDYDVRATTIGHIVFFPAFLTALLVVYGGRFMLTVFSIFIIPFSKVKELSFDSER